MARLGDLVVTIGAKTKSFDKALGDSMRKLKNFGRSTKRLGKDLSMGVTAPLAIMGATAVQAFRVQAKAIAQVEAGLQSTGSQVGYTSKQLQDMASSLQGKTLFGDEDILQNATAQLLTFTNISGEQFARTQAAALDLATRLDGDLKGASIQLGKALNDPVANLSALSRSGIQFSEEQKEVIKTMAQSGRLADAQTLILDELNKQYGGSAEAAAKADGGITQLANAFGDLQEQFGQILVGVLQPIVKWAQDLITKFQGLSRETQQYIVLGAGIAAALGPLLFLLPQIAAVIGMIASPVGLVIAAIALLATGIYMFAEEVSKPLADVANFFINLYNESKAVRAIIGGLKGTVKVVFNFFKNAVNNVIENFKSLGTIITAALEGRFSDIPGLISDAFKASAERNKEFAKQAAEDWKTSIQDELDKEPIEFVSPESIQEGIETIGGLKTAVDEMFAGVSFGGGGGPAPAPAAQTAAAQIDPVFAEIEDTDPAEVFADEEAYLTSWAEGVENAKEANERFNQSVQRMAGSLQGQFSNLFSGLMNGTQSFGEFMRKTLTDLLIQLASMAAAFAVISILMPGSSVAQGGLGAFLKGGFNIPTFADGGIISGPTLGLMGEYGNAATNPEVIAPLDRLQAMMGGAQNVTVTGRIDGTDILLTSERSDIYRNRIRGY